MEFSSEIDFEELELLYRPPEAQLQLPETPETLDGEGTVDDEILAVPVTYSLKSSPRHGVPYSLKLVPQKVTHKDIGWLSDAGVRGMVSTICDGTFESRPASLIVLTFTFRSGEHGFRFKNSNVKMRFANHVSTRGTTDGLDPSVAKFAPRKIYGIPTLEGKKHNIGGEISLQVPVGAVSVGPSLSVERESSYEETHRYRIVGNLWSSKQASGWDTVYWDMQENKRTKMGIPDRLTVGVVVERYGAFTAEVEVTVDTPVMNGIFGFPWSKEKPVTFVPGVEIGEGGVRTRKFEELGDDDWKRLIPHDEEWENRITLEPSGKSSAPPDYTET